MAPLTKLAEKNLRWLVGSSDSALSPSAIEGIQKGALSYTYKGVRTVKNPFDLALYQLLLWRDKPRTIIEIGTHRGGSALWLADQLDVFGIDGVVHSLDLQKIEMPAHPRVNLHQGDAKELGGIFSPEWLSRQPRPLLVIDDGSHICGDVLAALKYFGPFMNLGEYILVEDGIVRDMRSAHKFDGGPARAIEKFLGEGAPFEVDRSFCDFFGRNVTWNINGYLRRI